MKKQFKSLMMFCLLITSMVYLAGCSKDDPDPQLTGDSKEYVLSASSNPAISGTITFAKRNDNTSLLTIQLTGTQAGGSHPAHIHANTAAESGTILIDLTTVDGATGKSVTVIKTMNDGTPITYEELIAFDGHVKVHVSSTDLGTLIAQGDIGQNALTGVSKAYTLNTVSNPDISGTATFAERVNGETLVTLALTGTTTDATHPAHIHANSAAQGGSIVIDLTSVVGATGKSLTNISKLNNGTAITYTELLDYNGYINVHLSSTSLGTLVAQGDIGQNELTGVNKVYTLNAVGGSGISGTATFAARKNGFTLVTLSLTGTTAGGSHPAHLHNGSVASPGGIAINLTNVNGDGGKSRTNITQKNDLTAITYAQLLTYNGYINVHLSAADLGTIAQGNIGSNAP